MRTQHKLFLILFLSFFIIVITILFVFHFQRDQKRMLSESYAVQLEKNINDLLVLNSGTLHQVANDYTFWDEMVNFLHTHDKKWANENIHTMMVNFKVDAVWVFDSARNNFYSEQYENIPLNLNFSDSTLMFNYLHFNRFIKTHVAMDSLVVEIIGATIHPTNDPERITEPRGYFLLAKVWNSNYFHLLENITQGELTFVKNKPFKPLELKKDYVMAYSPVTDWNNRNVGFIQVEKKLEVLGDYERISQKMLFLIIISAVLTLGAFAYFSSLWVNKPLRLIEEILVTTDYKKVRQLKTFSREFRQISRLIFKFFKNNKDLKVAIEKSQKANKLKTAFLTNMSHEIRTPMNGIIGFSEQLINSDEHSKLRDKYITYIRQSCNDLLHIIDDILDISMIEANEVVKRHEFFFIKDFFGELSKSFKQKMLMNKSNLTLHFIETPDTILRFNTDKKLLHKILSHLLDNALKFTEKGHVEVGYYLKDGSDLIFYVKDTGIGIEPSKLDIIFDNFRQGDETITRNFGGNGLGLPICKGLVTLLGGEIWVKSEFMAGSTFFFSIPYRSE